MKDDLKGVLSLYLLITMPSFSSQNRGGDSDWPAEIITLNLLHKHMVLKNLFQDSDAIFIIGMMAHFQLHYFLYLLESL